MTDTKPTKDALGDRMKAYEREFQPPPLTSQLPIYARIDGRAFSKFTKDMDRPFDERMTEAMIRTTEGLVRETKAKIGFTQSDEINLVFLGDRDVSEPFFGGKIQKLCSVLASIATCEFGKAILGWEPYDSKYATFDCRVAQLPTKEEAANMMLWRCQDAIKNSVSMACRAHHSHKEMHLKNQADMLRMLQEKGVFFDAYPESFRRGTFVRRVTEARVLTPDERAKVPAKHQLPIDALVERTSVVRLNVPPFHVVKNRAGFIFDAEDIRT